MYTRNEVCANVHVGHKIVIPSSIMYFITQTVVWEKNILKTLVSGYALKAIFLISFFFFIKWNVRSNTGQSDIRVS